MTRRRGQDELLADPIVTVYFAYELSAHAFYLLMTDVQCFVASLMRAECTAPLSPPLPCYRSRRYKCQPCLAVHIPSPPRAMLAFACDTTRSLLPHLDHHVGHLDLLLRLVLGRDLEDDILLMVWDGPLGDGLDELGHSAVKVNDCSGSRRTRRRLTSFPTSPYACCSHRSSRTAG